MSQSVPSESSAIDSLFVVGTDLVEFHRHDQPIYLAPDSRWAEAGLDDTGYAAPLDRLFGEAGEVFVEGTPGQTPVPAMGEDTLVVLSDLSDGTSLVALEDGAPAHQIAAPYDYSDAGHALVHVPDGFSWEQAATDWSFDHHHG